MKNKIIVLDFAGTLIKREIIEEANKLRSEILQRSLPSRKEHANPERLYKVNRDFVKKLTGIEDKFVIDYRENGGRFMKLTGEQMQNQIATNLFQLGMYITAYKYKSKIIREGLVKELQREKRLGYKLAIISGVRTDIISGMLQIAKLPVKFDYIYGQPPILGMENQKELVKDLRKHGTIKYTIGDKISDLERIPEAKKIFFRGGHEAGGEEKLADYTINKAKELENIIK